MSPFPRPTVGWSACLGLRACRYDGSQKTDPLGPRFREAADLLDFCPEEEAGLGTPRPPLDLVYHTPQGFASLLEKRSRQDRAPQVREVIEGILARLDSAQGVVLKSRSPSCALGDAARFDEHGAPLPPGPGLLGQRLIERGGALLATEADLSDPGRRELWLIGLFQLARLDATNDLEAFHAGQRTLLRGIGCLEEAESLKLDRAAYRALWVRQFNAPPAWEAFTAHLGAPAQRPDAARLARQVDNPGCLRRPYPPTLAPRTS